MVGTICYYLLGHAFSFGESAGGFIGTTNFALSDSNVDYVAWIYRLAFAASSATVSMLENG